jgi:hypothetical protein
MKARAVGSCSRSGLAPASGGVVTSASSPIDGHVSPCRCLPIVPRHALRDYPQPSLRPEPGTGRPGWLSSAGYRGVPTTSEKTATSTLTR